MVTAQYLVQKIQSLCLIMGKFKTLHISQWAVVLLLKVFCYYSVLLLCCCSVVLLHLCILKLLSSITGLLFSLLLFLLLFLAMPLFKRLHLKAAILERKNCYVADSVHNCSKPPPPYHLSLVTCHLSLFTCHQCQNQKPQTLPLTTVWLQQTV